MLGICRGAGVHTAIETCLSGSWDVVERFIPLTDLFIVDLKITDRARHAEHTGRPNDLIFDNYARLARAGVELLTRIPLIPGITATEGNVTSLARFIGEKNPGGRVELINFNPLAINKYALMDRGTEFFNGMAPLPEGEVEELRTRLDGEGLAVVREHRRSGGAGR